MIGQNSNPVNDNKDLIFSFGRGFSLNPIQDPKLPNVPSVLPPTNQNSPANTYGVTLNGLKNYEYALISCLYSNASPTDFTIELRNQQFGANNSGQAYFKPIETAVNPFFYPSSILVKSVLTVQTYPSSSPLLKKFFLVDLRFLDKKYLQDVYFQISTPARTTAQIQASIEELVVFGSNDTSLNFFLT